MTTAPWIALTLLALLDPRCGQRLDTGLPPPPDQEAAPGDLEFDHEHALWTKLLQRHLEGARLDYRALADDRADFDLYLQELRRVRADQLAGWTREQRYAFWINAYNAYCVHLVLMHYPVKSIKDIGSLVSPVWKKEFAPLGHLDGLDDGEPISLDRIEHDILRPDFEDARVHAAINCASESCPPLRAEAYRADRLDAQLDEQVRAWLADSSLNRFLPARRRLELSAIFDWFESDFVRDAGSVRAWVVRYAPEDEAAWLLDAGQQVTIDHLPYSWRLNDVERERR